jgi:Protein of unknown function (DUF2735)
MKRRRDARGTRESRVMTTNFHQGSAKIYQFPARVRPASSGDRQDASSSDALSAPRMTVSGSAWYHEEAVREAEQAGRK